MPRAQAVRRTVEVSSKILDGPDVVAYGMLREVTTLEFFQHHFSKTGHRDTSCDPHLYPSHQATTAPLPHAKRPPRKRLRANMETIYYAVRLTRLVQEGFRRIDCNIRRGMCCTEGRSRHCRQRPSVSVNYKSTHSTIRKVSHIKEFPRRRNRHRAWHIGSGERRSCNVR